MSWYPDTGANNHITPDLSALHIAHEYTSNDKLHVGDGTGLSIQHTGTAFLPSSNGSLSLKNVLHVSRIVKNLLSVHRLSTDNHYYFEFWPSHFSIKDQVTKKVLL